MGQSRRSRCIRSTHGFLDHITNVTAKPLTIAKISNQLMLILVDNEYDVVYSSHGQVIEHELGHGLVAIVTDDGVQFLWVR